MNNLQKGIQGKKIIISEINGSRPVGEYFRGKKILGAETIIGEREVSREALKNFVKTPVNQLLADGKKGNEEKEPPKFEFHGVDESGNFGFSYMATNNEGSVDIRLWAGSMKFAGGEDIPQSIIERNLVLRIEADERNAASFRMIQNEILDLYKVYEQAQKLIGSQEVKIRLLDGRACYLVSPSVENLVENAKRMDGGFAPGKKIERFGITILKYLSGQCEHWFTTEYILNGDITRENLNSIPDKQKQRSVKDVLPEFAGAIKSRITDKIDKLARRVGGDEKEHAEIGARSLGKMEEAGLLEEYKAFMDSLPGRIEESLKGWEALYKN